MLGSRIRVRVNTRTLGAYVDKFRRSHQIFAKYPSPNTEVTTTVSNSSTLLVAIATLVVKCALYALLKCHALYALLNLKNALFKSAF